jgi:hypothetical protein
MQSWNKAKSIDSQTKNADTKTQPKDDGAEKSALKAAQFLKTGGMPEDKSNSDDSKQDPNSKNKSNKK